MLLAKPSTVQKEEPNECKAAALMTVRETRISYFNIIEHVLKAHSIVTVGVVMNMQTGINETVASKKWLLVTGTCACTRSTFCGQI